MLQHVITGCNNFIYAVKQQIEHKSFTAVVFSQSGPEAIYS